MRHGRAKAARKTLQYFIRAVGLQTKPYHVLVDGSFVASMFQQKMIPIPSRMERVLQIASTSSSNHTHHHQQHVKYFITQASIQELQLILESLEMNATTVKKKKHHHHDKVKVFQDALEWIRKECTILRQQQQPQEEDSSDDPSKQEGKESSSTTNIKMMSAQDAIRYHCCNRQLQRQHGNDSHKNSNETKMGVQHTTTYILATQDEELLNEFRSLGTIPLVRLANNNSVLLLEQPSKQSQRKFDGMEKQKWKQLLPDAEQALVELVKEKDRNNNTAITSEKNLSSSSASPLLTQHHRRVKTKAKGPNPLSCKRKRNDGDLQNNANMKVSSSKKRRDRRAAKLDKPEEDG